tara:strand:+ start:5758 stop:7044 length:1287 start_codon:yes stop_codon:yes gene_type:complete
MKRIKNNPFRSLMIHFIQLIFLPIYITSCSIQTEPDLATVNGDRIILSDFLPKYASFLSKTYQKDNLSNRYAFLNSLIDEKLILDHASEAGLDNDPDMIYEKEKIHDQLLLNDYYDIKIINDIHITNNELRILFKYYKTRLHVRHLYAPDIKTIIDIADKIGSGVSWEYLAKTCFEDSVLKNNGGDLGWYKMGELDPAFEIAAYGLSDGEISEPIKTRNGYSIIQVIEKEKDILLTEDDYQLNKDWLEQMAVRYKMMPKLRKFTDSIVVDLAIEFNDKGLLDLLDGLNENQDDRLSYRNSPVLTVKGDKPLTVEDCIAYFSKLSDKQFKRINSVETLKTVLSGILARDKMIKDAKDLLLHKSRSFQEILKQEYTSLILKETMSEINRSVDVNWQEEYFKFRNGLVVKSKISIDSTQVRSFPMVVEASL